MRTLGVLVMAFSFSVPVPADEPPIAQAKPTLSSVRRIYLGEFGSGEGADLVREKVRIFLASSGRFTVVESPDAADAILTGAVEVTTRNVTSGSVYGGTGTVTTTPSTHAQGTLRLVHLKTQEAIWSFDTPRVWGFGNKAKLLAQKVVDALMKDAAREMPSSRSSEKAVPQQ